MPPYIVSCHDKKMRSQLSTRKPLTSSVIATEMSRFLSVLGLTTLLLATTIQAQACTAVNLYLTNDGPASGTYTKTLNPSDSSRAFYERKRPVMS